MEQFRALLTASYGRHYLAERIAADCSHGGPLIQVSTPAKQHVGAVGDRLLLESTSLDQARIIQIEERRDCLENPKRDTSVSIAGLDSHASLLHVLHLLSVHCAASDVCQDLLWHRHRSDPHRTREDRQTMA